MFRSKKTDESNYINNLTISNFNDACNGAPKVTSTPLHTASSNLRRNSVVYSPPKKHFNTTRRYSLSEVSGSSNKSILGSQSEWQGPLLASLNYKDNISMYEETKSSGLVERVVSYNKEAERLPEPTHQEKYNSPGLFPIVHLFRRKTPILEHSSNKVKIRLSNSNTLGHSPIPSKTVDVTRISIKNKHHLLSNNQTVNESGTKSVLDALKEISRKRIHSNEDFDNGNEESGKRIRTELPNGSSSNSKRGRENSPLMAQEVSPKQIQKKLCVYDEYAASKSSTDFSFLKKIEPKPAKRKTISTSTESFNETKRKLINVETQTVSTVEEVSNAITSTDGDNNDVTLKKGDNSVKIFRDTPLDKIRKNRLTALMGNLVRKEAALNHGIDNFEDNKREEKEAKLPQCQNTDQNAAFGTEQQKEKVTNDEADDRGTISIITSPKTVKDPATVKSDKHVHFNLSSSIPQKSTQVIDAVISTVAVSATNTFSSINASTNSSIVNTSVFDTKSTSAPTFSFGQNAAASVTTNSSIKESAKNVTLLNNSAKTSHNKLNEQSTISPIKGGFKFDLKMPMPNPVSSSITITTTTNNSVPNMIFSSSPLANVVTTTVSSSTDSGITFSLGSNAAKSTSVVPDTKLSSSSFAFGKSEEKKEIRVAQKNTFPIITSAEGDNTGPSNVTFSFNNKSPVGFGSNPITTFSNSASSTTPSFSFSNPVLKSTTLNFASMSNTTEPTKTTASASPGFTFGLGTGNNSIGSVGPISSTTPPTFGSVTTTASSGFGSNTVSLNLSTKPTFKISGGEGFGKTITQTTTSCPVSTAFSFGGGATAPLPSSSKPFNFGSSTSTTSTSSIFGSIQTTVVSKDNKPNKTTAAFGATNIGFKTATTAAGSAFGSGQTSSTGAIFGNALTSAPMFTASAPSSTPVFGSTVSTPVFGTSSSTFGSPVVTSAPTFGTDKNKSFGSGNVFGNVKNTPTFGSAAAPTFGSTAKPLFGTSSNPSSNTVAPTFGASVGSTFGTTTTSSSSSFNTTTTAPSFNFGSSAAFSFGGGTETKPSSRFGSGTSNSSFGKPATTQNTPQFGTNDKGFNATTSTFGSNTSSFGAAALPFGNSNNAFGGSVQPQNSSFNFNAAPVSGSFMSADTSKPTFNFTGAASNQPFGSNTNSGTFTSFNAPVSTFGAPITPTTGVFNIGSGSTSNRPRAQARAKRRT